SRSGKRNFRKWNLNYTRIFSTRLPVSSKAHSVRLSNNSPLLWRPYTQEKTASPAVRIKSAKGPYLYAENGQRIIDGISSWWLITHGHCMPEIVDAIQGQAATLDQVTFADFTHEPAEQLAELLIEITPPELTKVFLSDNGSTAVEVALKIALQSCAQSGQTRRKQFVAFERAYHGDTVGAMSVSGSSAYNRPYQRTLFDVIRCKHPTRSDAPIEEWVKDFENVMAREHRTVAGVIVEPLVQGAGGFIVWPEMAMTRIADLCRHYEVNLIFDEVMTGFGRTGRLFAMDRLSVTPDILCLSKGLTGGSLPLAATLVTRKIYDSFFSSEKSRMLFHGHSFTGNPISCAAAVANIRLFAKGNMRRKWEEIQTINIDQIKVLGSKVPLSDARVCGTIAAFEFDSKEKDYLAIDQTQLASEALSEGLFIRPMGTTFYLMLPYRVSAETQRTAWEILLKVLVN
ncbi:MAG: adenosylmethionine--8-amino-7-oxononanoate transaminase, partial [Bdellovibrio sp.]